MPKTKKRTISPSHPRVSRTATGGHPHQTSTLAKGPPAVCVFARIGKAMIPFLQTHLPPAIAMARSSIHELSVVLVNDKQIGDLHQQFFNDPRSTDVITFPMDVDRRGRAISGELYLCVPMARKQAKLRGLLPEHELLLYAIHGVLHLSGHDDLTDADYQRMHRAEDRILRTLGLGNVFVVPSRAEGSQ